MSKVLSKCEERVRDIKRRGNWPADHDTQVFSNEKNAMAYRNRQRHPLRWGVARYAHGRWVVWYVGVRNEANPIIKRGR